MNRERAFLAGVAGGLVMTAISAVTRTFGAGEDLEMLIGTLAGGGPHAGRWLLGLVVHLSLAGLFGMLYAAGFEHLVRRSGIHVGVLFGAVHAVAAGWAVGMADLVHPGVPLLVDSPGAFMANYGPIALGAFVVKHLLFGAVVGSTYGTVWRAELAR